MPRLPSFLRKPLEEKECLFENDYVYVKRAHTGETVMSVEGCDWEDRFVQMAWDHGVTRLVLAPTVDEDNPTIDYLADLPPLRSLRMRIWADMDLTVLESLASLEEFRIISMIKPRKVDFTKLINLKECTLVHWPAFASILECSSLRRLELSEGQGIKTLDLTKLKRLTELGLVSYGSLRTIELHKSTKLRVLLLAACRKLELDWPRITRDLKYFALEGKQGFPLEQLVAAEKLEFLRLGFMGKLPDLSFLEEMQSLRTVDLIPNVKPSPENLEIVERINERKSSHSK